MISLDPLWAPVTVSSFKLKDFVAYALGQGPSLHWSLLVGERDPINRLAEEARRVSFPSSRRQGS